MAKLKNKSLLKNYQLRRTRLYIPGNNPAMIQNASIYGADSLIFDLEDSIPISEKDAARHLVRNAIQELNFINIEVTVRINGIDTEYYLKDLEAIIPAKPNGILVPKTETLAKLKQIDKDISRIEKENNLPNRKIMLMPIIESALGVLNVEQIAKAPRVVAIGLGGEDLIADIRAKQSKENRTLDYIKSKIILVCAANKIQAIDTVFIDINDPDGLFHVTLKAIEMGFQGKSIIHPSQIEPVHEAFTPTDDEIEKAERIVKAYKESIKQGMGAISVDGRMIDLPVVIQAEKVLQRAKAKQKKN
ncbi:MAG: citrate lyase subunit beta [Asgard group archaeon]|nr:citrate lyase subunit beta [Asgard group archaeon]